MKKVLFGMSMLLSLGMFCACSKSDDTTEIVEGQNPSSRTSAESSDIDKKWIEAEGVLANYCFDGTFIKESPDGKMIIVYLDENPIEALARFGVCYVAFQKSDLPDREYKEGDHIFFKIIKHGEEYGEYDPKLFLAWGVYVRYNCVVEPC